MVPFAYVKFLEGLSRGCKRKVEVTKINYKFKDLYTFNDIKPYFVQDEKDNNKYYRAQIIFMEESEQKLDEAVRTRRQRVKSSQHMDTASESEMPKKLSKTKSLLVPTKKIKNLQEMKKYDTICAVKLEKIDRGYPSEIQQPQNINEGEKENLKQLEKVAEKTATELSEAEPSISIHKELTAHEPNDDIGNDDFEESKPEQNSPEPSISKLSVSNLQTKPPACTIGAPSAQNIENQASTVDQSSASSSSVISAKGNKNKSGIAAPKILSNLTIIDCIKKVEDLEKQLKGRNKTVEKYHKLQKDYEAMEKKYKHLKKKLDDSEKQVVEYGELNKQLQKQLLEKNDAEKADSTKTMP